MIGRTLEENGIPNVFVKGNVYVRNRAVTAFKVLVISIIIIIIVIIAVFVISTAVIIIDVIIMMNVLLSDSRSSDNCILPSFSIV